jgi:hypothetical protein
MEFKSWVEWLDFTYFLTELQITIPPGTGRLAHKTHSSNIYILQKFPLNDYLKQDGSISHGFIINGLLGSFIRSIGFGFIFVHNEKY